jgi:small subunit ribosomal protein S1
MTPETEFDPTRYGMAAEYDNEGNYIYPEGFDVETGDWAEGFEKQREEWERQYAEAHVRFEQHITQLKKSAEADAAAGAEEGSGGVPAQYSSDSSDSEGASGGSLASDEQLAALREKLSGGA